MNVAWATVHKKPAPGSTDLIELCSVSYPERRSIARSDGLAAAPDLDTASSFPNRSSPSLERRFHRYPPLRQKQHGGEIATNTHTDATSRV
jgi:hypothetical protein